MSSNDFTTDSLEEGDVVFLKGGEYSGRPQGYECRVIQDRGDQIEVYCVPRGETSVEPKSYICSVRHGPLHRMRIAAEKREAEHQKMAERKAKREAEQQAREQARKEAADQKAQKEAAETPPAAEEDISIALDIDIHRIAQEVTPFRHPCRCFQCTWFRG